MHQAVALQARRLFAWSQAQVLHTLCSTSSLYGVGGSKYCSIVDYWILLLLVTERLAATPPIHCRYVCIGHPSRAAIQCGTRANRRFQSDPIRSHSRSNCVHTVSPPTSKHTTNDPKDHWRDRCTNPFCSVHQNVAVENVLDKVRYQFAIKGKRTHPKAIENGTASRLVCSINPSASQ